MLKLFGKSPPKKRENELIERLYKEHSGLLMKTALALLKNYENAEDAVAETLAKALEKPLENYTIEQNKKYLFLTLKGICLDMLSKNSRAPDELSEEFPDDCNVEKTAEEKLTLERVKENINNLSPALKNIAEMYFIGQFSEREISKLQKGTSKNPIQTRTQTPWDKKSDIYSKTEQISLKIRFNWSYFRPFFCKWAQLSRTKHESFLKIYTDTYCRPDSSARFDSTHV